MPGARPSKTPAGRKIGRTKSHIQQRRAIFCRIAAISGFAWARRARQMAARPRKQRAALPSGVGAQGAGHPGQRPAARHSQKLIQGATKHCQNAPKCASNLVFTYVFQGGLPRWLRWTLRFPSADLMSYVTVTLILIKNDRCDRG